MAVLVAVLVVVVLVRCLAPRCKDVLLDLVESLLLLDCREDRWAITAHLGCVTLHHTQVRAHCFSQINLVDDQQVRLRHSGSALAWHLIATRNVDDVDGKVCKLCARGPTEAAQGGQVGKVWGER
jgi:hypothetical protein